MESGIEVGNEIVGFDISATFVVPLPWDVLVSESDSCLDGYAPGFVNHELVKQLPASYIYRLWQDELGELGTVEIQKLGANNSEISVSGVPINSIDNSPMWLRVKPDWERKINEALKGKRKIKEQETEIEAYLAISKEEDDVKARIKAKQKNHQANVIRAYFSRLVNKLNLWVAYKVIPPPYIIAVAGLSEWPDMRMLSQETREYFEKYKVEVSKSSVQQLNTSKPKEAKQKRGAQLETEFSLERLREIRLEAIKNNRPIPKKTAAMNQAGITDKTWKMHDKELWARWDDKSYNPEKQE